MSSRISRNIPKSLWGHTVGCHSCHRARRFAGLHFAALLHGSSNGLLWIRDRMVCGVDGEAKADKSVADTTSTAKVRLAS